MSYAGIDIGSRLELFVDEQLIERLSGAELRLHQPQPQNVALRFDAPWEGNSCGYVTVFQDGDIYRMYYRGLGYMFEAKAEYHPPVCCYAESRDGIEWHKPSLGLVEFDGSTDNNIVLDDRPATNNFTPFKDANPDCRPDEVYKGVGGDEDLGLIAYKSADGVRWTKMADRGIITNGFFDSQNLIFWDKVRGEYREYHRDFVAKVPRERDIKTSSSRDFMSWPDPEWISYSPGRVSQLYTNGVTPYYRAPHIFLGFPTRYVDRGWTESTHHLPQQEHRRTRGSRSRRESTAVTDGMFMSSRDGQHFNVWPESFLRPGLRLKENWFYGDNYQNWGLVETPLDHRGGSQRDLALRQRGLLPGPGQQEAAPVHHTHRWIRLRERATLRRRAPDQASCIRRQCPGAELLVVRRRRRESGGPGCPGLCHRWLRPLRLPRGMGRRHGAHGEVGRYDRRVEACGPAGEAALRHQGRRPVLHAVPQGATQRAVGRMVDHRVADTPRLPVGPVFLIHTPESGRSNYDVEKRLALSVGRNSRRWPVDDDA